MNQVDAIEDFTHYMRRVRVRRWLALGSCLAAGAIGIGLFAWRSRGQLPDLDAKKLASVRAALAQGALPQEFAAAALAELEPDRLPRAIVTAFEAVPRVAPDQQRLVLMRAFLDAEVADAFHETCTGGPSVMAEMIQLPPGEQAAYLYRQCKLARLGFLDVSEARRADGPTFAIAAISYAYLDRRNALEETEVTLLRMLVR